MSYVDAIYDRHEDKIKVVERVDGERIFKDFPAEYVFYYEHPAGQHRSIYGDACKKYTTTDSRKFRRELDDKSAKHKIFESDINPVFRSLATHYRGAPTPKLNIGFFDIEVEFDVSQGFAPVTNPFNRVNAISVYLNWIQCLVTLVLIPPTLTLEQAETLAAEFENTYLFEDEGELLRAFLDLIADCDVLSGWNSTGFDIPYLVNRITRVLGENCNRQFCLWDKLPREREYEKFKRKHKTYDLVGRVHIDYLALYQKHNPQQLHSYRLDYVGEIEVGENKIPYEGTLDELWKRDFTKFIGYNRQDTLLLPKIDNKKKFIELSNQIAHANCVVLKTTMGSVALVEQAIINEFHDMGFVVPDRRRKLEERKDIEEAPNDEDEEEEEKKPVCGAYVAKPKVGLHDEIGCVDINSLYPSAIRALNMSVETLIGQFRPDLTQAEIDRRIAIGIKGADVWEGLFGTIEYTYVTNRDETPLTVDFEDGTSKTMSARDWYEYIFNPANQLCVTANGTIFSTKKDGMIPQLLAKWYAGRKTTQKEQKTWGACARGVKVPSDLAARLREKI
jgi:DNA polymerase elongation subunit (family B)